MVNFQQISLMLQLEVFEEDNKFTVEQVDKLLTVCDKISALDTDRSNPVKKIGKYKTLEKQYNEEHFLFGGNSVRLNQKYRDFEEMSIPLAKEFFTKLTLLKKRLKL